MIKYLESIIESELFEGINKENYITALEELQVSGKKLAKETAVYYEGDIIDKICIVSRGSVRGEKTYSDGEVHIIEIYEEYDILGLEAAVSKLRTAPMDYICCEDTMMVFIPMAALDQCGYRREIIDVLMHKMADDNIKKMRKIEILAERGLRDRILIFLNILKKKSQSSVVDVKMNREQMAQFLCVSRSALSNELNKMKRENIIDFNKGKFKIL